MPASAWMSNKSLHLSLLLNPKSKIPNLKSRGGGLSPPARAYIRLRWIKPPGVKIRNWINPKSAFSNPKSRDGVYPHLSEIPDFVRPWNPQKFGGNKHHDPGIESWLHVNPKLNAIAKSISPCEKKAQFQEFASCKHPQSLVKTINRSKDYQKMPTVLRIGSFRFHFYSWR